MKICKLSLTPHSSVMNVHYNYIQFYQPIIVLLQTNSNLKVAFKRILCINPDACFDSQGLFKFKRESVYCMSMIVRVYEGVYYRCRLLPASLICCH